MVSAPTTLPSISWDTLFTSRNNDNWLGNGAFSTVYRCYHEAHGDVAVKILTKNGQHSIHSFDEEGRVHLKANTFPHILRLIGLSQRTGFVGLVLEYMPYGSLADVIHIKKIAIPWTFRLRALSEAASAVAYLHNLSEDKRVIHCDLKAENILLSSDLHVKISDFGGAKVANYTGVSIEPSVSSRQKNAELFQYTISHVAPEIWQDGNAKRTTAMDVYSFAVVMYTLTSRETPFPNVPHALLPTFIIAGQRPNTGLAEIKAELEASGDRQSLNVFNLLVHLFQHCWDQDPQKRLSMIKVRDSLKSKLDTFPQHLVSEDVLNLKRQMGERKHGRPTDPITVFAKYQQMHSGFSGEPSVVRSIGQDTQRLSIKQPEQPVLDTPIQPGRETKQPLSPPSRSSPIVSPSEPIPRPRLAAEASASVKPPSRIPGIEELEQIFADPFLRMGNSVRLINDLAAIKNAQVGHGGWNDSMKKLLDAEGNIVTMKDNGDVTVSFSGVSSHCFNPNSLIKLPSVNTLHVGDFVNIEIDRELVEVMQEGHGGWIEDMQNYFSQSGLIFRFLQDRDVLVVYKNGMYFRFNPEIFCKIDKTSDLENLSAPDNPDIKIGDYVCHDLEEDLMKEMQESCGGWNEVMSRFRGKVGKFVYVDYHGRAFVAYDCKQCFVFNPAVITKLSDEEAFRRFKEDKNEAARVVRQKAVVQIGHHRFAAGDKVRVCLPLDIVVMLQAGHGGWCYQMLEVYGREGVVKDFDDNDNAQVLLDTGNKWTFNPAVLEKAQSGSSSTSSPYMPPFKIGDKVRVRIKELTNHKIDDQSFNKMMHVFRMLDIPEEQVDILMKTGKVLGIDDDIDVIVTFGDGKNYGFKPQQLQKLN